MKVGIKTKARRKRGGDGDGIINSSAAAKQASNNATEAATASTQLATASEIKKKCKFEQGVIFSSKINEEFKKYIEKKKVEEENDDIEVGGGNKKYLNLRGGASNLADKVKNNLFNSYLIDKLIEYNRFNDITSVLDIKFLSQDSTAYSNLLENIDSSLNKFYTSLQDLYSSKIEIINNEKLEILIKDKYQDRIKKFIQFCLSLGNTELQQILNKTFADTYKNDYLQDNYKEGEGKGKEMNIYKEKNFSEFYENKLNKYENEKKRKKEEITENEKKNDANNASIKLVEELKNLDYLFEMDFSKYANTFIRDLFLNSTGSPDIKIDIKEKSESTESTVPDYTYIYSNVNEIWKKLIEFKQDFLDKKFKKNFDSIINNYIDYLLDTLKEEESYFRDDVLEKFKGILSNQKFEIKSNSGEDNKDFYENINVEKLSDIKNNSKKKVDEEFDPKTADKKKTFDKDKLIKEEIYSRIKKYKNTIFRMFKIYCLSYIDFDEIDLDSDTDYNDDYKYFIIKQPSEPNTSSTSGNSPEENMSTIVDISKKINQLIDSFPEVNIKRLTDYIDDFDPIAAAQQKKGKKQMEEAQSGELNIFRFFIPVYTGRKVRVFTATQEFPQKLEIQSNDYGSYVSSLKNIMEPYTSNIKDAESNPKCLGVLNYSSTANVFTRDQYKEDSSTMCYDRKEDNEIIKKLREDSVKNEEDLQNKVTGISRPVFYELGKGVVTKELFFNGDTLAVEVIIAIIALQDNKEGHRYNLPIFKDKNLEADINQIDFNLDAPGLRIKLKDLKELNAAKGGGISHLFGFRKVDYMANLAAQARYPVNYEVDLEQFVYVIREKMVNNNKQ